MQLGNFQFGGYAPWISPGTPSDGPFVVDGRNIKPTSSGIRSAWGSTRYAGEQVEAIFSLGHDLIQLTNGKVLDALGRPVFSFSGGRYSGERCAYPWSRAHVGCDHVFSHPDHPLLVWNAECGWREWCDPAWASPIFGVAPLANRLLVQLQDVLLWSDLDDPCSFQLGRTEGSGFQSLNLAEFGTPLGVYATQAAAYSFTTNGIMRTVDSGQVIYTADNSPTFNPTTFNHVRYSCDHPPSSSRSIARIDKSAVMWISKGMLFSSGQSSAEQAAPAAASYMRERFPDSEFALGYTAADRTLHIKGSADYTLTLSLELEAFGTWDGDWRQMTSEGHYIENGRACRFDDSTRYPSHMTTSGLRMPTLNIYDRQTREVLALGAEIHEVCDEPQAYGVGITTGDGPKYSEEAAMLLGKPTRQAGRANFPTRVKGMYHSLRVFANAEPQRFHIAGLKINGQYAGVLRR